MANANSTSDVRPLLQLPAAERAKKRPATSKTGGKKSSASRRRVAHTVAGILVGLTVGFLSGDSTVRLYTGCGGFGGSGQRLDQAAVAAVQWPAEDYSGTVNGTTSSADGRPATLLFVGVLTANQYLSTRAAAVHRTWARSVPGRVLFYTSETSVRPLDAPDLPLVRLATVDDSYPPQKKSFLMLQHMWDNYGDKYEWFMRADDDVYVRPDKLETLLRSVDSRRPVFMGQAGRGNQEEFGLLSLEYDENFCMGGPGVIMSRETLSRVVPHIKHCLKNLFTTHEDVELGRCVQKFAGVPCTWSYEMQTIFYHNSSGREAFTGNLKQKEVHRAITLHPIKQHSHMYRIHNYMKGLKLQDIQQKKILLHRDIRAMIEQLSRHQPQRQPSNEFMLTNNSKLFNAKPGSPNYLGDPDLLGWPPGLNKFRPRRIVDVIKWDFISKSWFSDTDSNPRRRIESYAKEGLDDVVREVMDIINKFSKQRGRVIEFKEIFYGYHRVNPLYGVDYVLDMLLMYKKYRGKKMTVPVRRHAYLQQQFTNFEIREVMDGVEIKQKLQEESVYEMGNEESAVPVKDILDNGLLGVDGQPVENMKHSLDQVRLKTVNFVLPLFNRNSTFVRFMDNYESVCLANDERVTLTIVPFGQATLNQALAAVDATKAKYPTARVKVLPDLEDSFARALALDLGSSRIGPPEDLLFFVDVDMLWTNAMLNRIRLNTVRNRSVYFPIVYSEFDPVVVYGQSVSPNHFLINQDSGYWRQYGYGIVSVYKSDLVSVGNFDTSIRGWGKEDVDLFEKFVKRNPDIIMRVADPDLVHVFHAVECDSKLSQQQAQMCKNTRFETYGNVDQLANTIYKNKDKFHRFVNEQINKSIKAVPIR
ncbi:chondroitin sulfate synthase 1-like [Adelges cooleyi]|uniref:chondroitin sulfate synthase 1-like n=1 Tax=Adelges cooleyi TaxID=133065 RepID=UPI0021800831|nr:chondroitin sulfate synthase 1-like [Adelges cooleyi]